MSIESLEVLLAVPVPVPSPPQQHVARPCAMKGAPHGQQRLGFVGKKTPRRARAVATGSRAGSADAGLWEGVTEEGGLSIGQHEGLNIGQH